ncbi:hypothetical protein ACGFXC_29935 [Streptomyces sp. NPDC048507]|uniref:hypothetical protein n=1 Tax=Streptomyces sp. NPDC048507 TaxID=3365560 RepID=UPI003717E677
MKPGLPSDVRDALDALLGTQDAAHRALLRQVPHLQVTVRCPCACGTTYFELDTDAVPAAPLPAGTLVAAEAQVYDADEHCTGEVLAFARDGYLSWLEVCSWNDWSEDPLTLADALRLLRP